MLRLGSLFVGPTGIFTVNAGCSIVGRSSSKRKNAQEASQPLVAPDVENVSPNAFKKMYTDHQRVAQRKCLLMQVPSLGIRRFDTAEISNNTDNPVNATGDALSSSLFGLESQSSQKNKSQIYCFMGGFLGRGGGSHQWSLFHMFFCGEIMEERWTRLQVYTLKQSTAGYRITTLCCS